MVKNKKIKYLDGLRGVASIVVVLQHLKYSFFQPQSALLITQFNSLDLLPIIKTFVVSCFNLFFDGNLAVWIFWLLSSYVISIKFFKTDKDLDKLIINYFTKRYFRLLIPVFISVIIAYLLLKFGFMYNLKYTENLVHDFSRKWIRLNYSFEPNFFMALKSSLFDTFFDYKTKSSYNIVLWTIKNEFLGSLFTFSVFAIIRHNSKRYYIYLIIFLVLIKLKVLWLSIFLLGHVLCDFDFSQLTKSLKYKEMKIHNYSKLIFFLSIILIIFSKKVFLIAQVPIEYVNFLCSILIVYITLRNRFFKRFFSNKICSFLGKISFSLYLIHVPIICSLSCYLIMINNNSHSILLTTSVTFLITIIIAYFFEKYIDRNSIILSNKIGNFFQKYN
jgi:peptidoglycan/LPS O-acetylase OafA/YrhL